MPTRIVPGNCTIRCSIRRWSAAKPRPPSGPGASSGSSRFKHKLLSLDSTLIQLCAETFDWAHYKRTKGALKLHLLLDHDGCLPCYAVVTDGKRGDIQEARNMTFAPGTLVVFDRGYPDHAWRLQLTRTHVHFVTRLKDDPSYGIVESRTVPAGSHILRDAVWTSSWLDIKRARNGALVFNFVIICVLF